MCVIVKRHRDYIARKCKVLVRKADYPLLTQRLEHICDLGSGQYHVFISRETLCSHMFEYMSGNCYS